MRVALAVGLAVAASVIAGSNLCSHRFAPALPRHAPRATIPPVSPFPASPPCLEEERPENLASAAQEVGLDSTEVLGFDDERKGAEESGEADTAGQGRLLLRLVDGDSGLPVSMRVRLWRVGIPEDEEWTQGDEAVGSVTVEENGSLVESLVPGRYRFHAPDQRKEAEDPPDFPVLPGENDLTARVLMPRTLIVHLRVFDEDGRPLERGNRRTTINSTYFSLSDPSWIRKRRRKERTGGHRDLGIGGSG